mmetsp:Transcript_30025/g.97760  ORF Transcript_30025/g.97760 Transcript_30025/m.97760 type:complete len:799 (+) Transcript_30025:140-2536(+)
MFLSRGKIAARPSSSVHRSRLPVGEAVEPAARVLPHQAFPDLVVAEDEERPRHSREPVQDVERARAEHHVERLGVAERGTEHRLEDETEVHELVAEALLEETELARLGDDEIGPLHDDDRDEVARLRVLERRDLVSLVRVLLLLAVPPVKGAHRRLGGGHLAAAREAPVGARLGVGDVVGAERLKLRRVRLGDGSRRVVLVGHVPLARAVARVAVVKAAEASIRELDERVVVPGVRDFAPANAKLLLHAEEGVRVLAAVPALVGAARAVIVAHERVILPVDAVAHEDARRVAVVVEHRHVGEKAGEGLHDANLEVGEGDEAAVHEAVGGSVARGAVHDVRLLLLVRERDGGHHVRAEVDAQNEHRRERQRDAQDDEAQEGANLRNVGGEGVRDRLLEIVEDEAALLHAVHDGGKVVVHENHVRSFLRHILAGDAHGDTNVTLLQRRSVVDTVACHRDNLAAALAVLDDEQLVRGRHARPHNLFVAEGVIPLLELLVLRELHPLADVVALDNRSLAGVPLVLVDDADVLGDRLGRDGVVARHHEHLDVGALALLHRLRHALARRVDERKETHKHEVVHAKVDLRLLRVRKALRLRHFLVGEPEHALAHTAKRFVSSGVLRLNLRRERHLLALDHDVLAPEEDALGGTLEHQDIGTAGLGVDGKLPLVGGVELDLEQLRVLFAHILNVVDGLGKLEQAALRSVAGGVEAQHVEGGVVHLVLEVNLGIARAEEELGVVAQLAHEQEFLEGFIALVVSRSMRRLHEVLEVREVARGRGFQNRVVVPAVLNSHAVLREGARLV